MKDMPMNGKVDRWSLGDVDDWATLYVDFGPFNAKVVLTSRQARMLALDVLIEQGPSLGYQPMNERMRENKNATPFDNGRRGGPGWEKRGRVRDCAEALAGLLDKYGDEVLGYALQKVADDA